MVDRINQSINSGAGNQEYIIICHLSSKCSFTLIFVKSCHAAYGNIYCILSLKWKCMGMFNSHSIITMQILKGRSQVMIYAVNYHSYKRWMSFSTKCVLCSILYCSTLYLISCNSLTWISSFDSLRACNELICTTISIALPLFERCLI